MKIILIILFALIGCDGNYFKIPYIKLDNNKLIERYGPYTINCIKGVLLNGDSFNIYDKNNKLIKCYGYIQLTDKERYEYLK